MSLSPLSRFSAGLPNGFILQRQAVSRGLSRPRFIPRAVLAALEAFGVECDIFQVHESFPAVSLILDLFENMDFNSKTIFQKAKKHIIGFAHTVVPQAFPFYDPWLIDMILGLDSGAYDKYLCVRGFLRRFIQEGLLTPSTP